MKTFIDNAGRTWTVSINVSTIKRVKDLLGVNLMEAVTGKLIEELEADICQYVNVIYCVCRKEADAKGVSDEAFGEALGGDALEKATDAFLDELIDFFPQAKRQIFRKAFQKRKDAETIGADRIGKKLDAIDVVKIVEEKLKTI